MHPTNLAPKTILPSKLRPNGFALLITIVLVAFLVLILVGLASFTRVETQVAGNAQQLASARQNALTGLNIALGQLQRYAGPDQKISARADLIPGQNNPLYVGIWSSNTSSPLNPATPDVWLVSGNEDPTTPLAITPSDDLTSDSQAVVLVGEGGAGPENPAPAERRHVRAKLREITSTVAPGAGGTATLIGAYAYWVGDEGVKARFNLGSPAFSTDPGMPPTPSDAAYAFAGASRVAVELMERAPTPLTGVPTASWTDDLYPVGAPKTQGIISLEQLPFLATSGETAAAQGASKARFHDLTAHSASVMADTAAGGLRQDLTRILESSSTGPADSTPIFPAVAGAPSTYPHQNPPAWSRLRDWWQTSIIDGGTIAPSLPDSTSPPIAPVVLWAELGLGFFYETLPTPANTYRIRAQAFPRLVLWNPYNVTLEGAVYEFAFSTVASDNTIIRIQRSGGDQFVRLFSFFGYRFSENDSFDGPPVGMGGQRFRRFRVDVPDLEAGQAKVFSIAPANSGSSFSQNVTTLEEGDFPATYTVFASEFYDYTTPTPPDDLEGIAFANQTSTAFLRAAGETQFHLRAGSLPLVFPSTTPNNAVPVDGVYRFGSRLGFRQISGLIGDNTPFAISDSPNIEPQLRLVMRMRMANVHPNHPMRWLANSNVMSFYLGRHESDGPAHPIYDFGFFSASSNRINSSPDDEVSVGRNMILPGGSAAPLRLRLVEPRLGDPGLYQSIAQLQHAPLNDTLLGPLYAVGNSLQNPRIINRATTSRLAGTTTIADPLYDYSHLLNTALWDRYFFSTVPAGLTDTQLASLSFRLPNSRLRPYAADSSLPPASELLNHDTAAANLLLQGGFNINSTSEQAWRAVLASAHRLPYNPQTGDIDSANPLERPFSRFLRPGGNQTDPWRGYRELTEAQHAALAAAIVAEIRQRGPFRSLADFVNRRLDSGPTGLKGTLQAAIDRVDLDTNPTRRINGLAPYNQDNINLGDIPGGSSLDIQAYTGTENGVPQLPVSSRNAFGPGYITQADVLSLIGSFISARSDTFLIRAYGESRNPATGLIEGKAWCEAVAQRLPEYINTNDAAHAVPSESDNTRFGRRFVITSFRWLTPEDI